MHLELDHLVVAARTLEEGVAHIEARAGVAMGPGGKHRAMGTHNRLLALGADAFLEVIAVDPAARAPGRPRWFSLDEPATRERLARGPALLHWVLRTDDIERALQAMDQEYMPVLDLTRGAFRWRIGVPENGALLHGGLFPTLIQWQGERPQAVLPESGCRLEALQLRGERAPAIVAALREAGLADARVQASEGATGLAARIATPAGTFRPGE